MQQGRWRPLKLKLDGRRPVDGDPQGVAVRRHDLSTLGRSHGGDPGTRGRLVGEGRPLFRSEDAPRILLSRLAGRHRGRRVPATVARSAADQAIAAGMQAALASKRCMLSRSSRDRLAIIAVAVVLRRILLRASDVGREGGQNPNTYGFWSLGPAQRGWLSSRAACNSYGAHRRCGRRHTDVIPSTAYKGHPVRAIGDSGRPH